MGSIKDRNGMHLTEAVDLKKRWQEYTELYKKDLQDSDNHNGAFKEHIRDFLEQIKVRILFAVAEILRVNTNCILASRKIDHFL